MNARLWSFSTGMAVLVMVGGCHSPAPGVVEPTKTNSDLAVDIAPEGELPLDSSGMPLAEAEPETAVAGVPDSVPSPCVVVDPPCVPKAMLISPGPDTSPFLTDENFLLDWQVLGPFPFEPGDFQGEQQQESVDFLFIAGEESLSDKTVSAPGSTTWQRTVPMPRGGQPGTVDLNAMFGGIDYACAYAVTEFSAPAMTEGVSLRVGSDDYIKIWLNGERVHTYNKERRAGDWDQDIIDGIVLRQGCNRLVVKCVDIVGSWSFNLRFTDANGMPFKVVPIPQEN